MSGSLTYEWSFYNQAMTNLPESEEALTAFLRAFEDGTLPKSSFTHAAHVLVGAAYCYTLEEEAALRQMRERVRAFNEAVGGKNTETSGYHETLTRFWIAMLSRLRRGAEWPSRVAFAQAAVERFGQQRDLHTDFYDFDVVASTEARRQWVAPSREAVL
jgi:hypothetical protein